VLQLRPAVDLIASVPPMLKRLAPTPMRASSGARVPDDHRLNNKVKPFTTCASGGRWCMR
jgi:hypothetical protein